MRFKLGAYTFIIKMGQFTNGRERIAYIYMWQWDWYVGWEKVCRTVVWSCIVKNASPDTCIYGYIEAHVLTIIPPIVSPSTPQQWHRRPLLSECRTESVWIWNYRCRYKDGQVSFGCRCVHIPYIRYTYVWYKSILSRKVVDLIKWNAFFTMKYENILRKSHFFVKWSRQFDIV